MPTIRIALAQVDPAVGDLPGNSSMIHEWTARAAASGAGLVVFPEMMLTGYPVEDLVFRESFVRASGVAAEAVAARLAGDGLGEIVTVFGYLDADGPARLSADAVPGRGPRNALAVAHRGRIVARYFKHHLPNYGVFDEDRYFVPGDTLEVIRLGGPAPDGSTPDRSASGGAVDIALTVCEDIWQAGGPFAVAREAGVGLVLNINGSPYEKNKDEARETLVARRAREAGATVAYLNMVGGQDELVYDGDSMIVDAEGRLLARAPQFTEHLLVHDLDLPDAGEADDEVDGDAPRGAGATTLRSEQGMRIERRYLPVTLTTPTGPRAVGGIAERAGDDAEVWQALVLGLRDYVRKNGFRSVVVALSGGIDSTVVAAIACDAVGASNVVGVSLPSSYSSEHSKDDAADLAKRTGLDYRVVPIQPMVDSFLAATAAVGTPLSGLAEENLQARVRAVVLMSLSNQEGHLVLTTGNKSELAVGYSTLYGDSVGGFNPLKDVPKTLVWQLARWRDRDAEERGEIPPIPENSITKPPSAELRPGQLDTDSLPDYPVLDAILAGYVDGDLGREGLIAAGHDPATVDRVLRLVDQAEYKRRQSAPGTKISIKAFGRDRRLPITNRYREAAAPARPPAHDPTRAPSRL